MLYDIEWLQTQLKTLGLYQDDIDGIPGPNTHDALIRFKRSVGLRARPYVGPITIRKLKEAVRARRGPVELPWINEINKVLGMHEVRDNHALTEWLRSDGRTLGDPSGDPWCGDAVETAIYRALPREPRFHNPYWARNWANFGVACGTAYGAVAVFRRGKGGHVGFLVGISEDGKLLRIRGGNQSNMVNDTWIDADRLIDLRWPYTFPDNQRPAPVMLHDGTISRNEA